MYVYDKLFTEYNHTVAQLLITAPDIDDGGSRKENFHNTLDRLLELGALPIINENDTDFHGGDRRGRQRYPGGYGGRQHRARTCWSCCSDIDGLYDRDPHKNPDAQADP